MRAIVRHIGVSKLCCPVCSAIINLLGARYGAVQTLGSHTTISACLLPPWLPEEFVDIIINRFEVELKEILLTLSSVTRKCSPLTASLESSALSNDEEVTPQRFQRW